MSKVYALSGARAAYLCAGAHQLEELRAITPPWVVSLPLWIWKGLMLAWSLWIAAKLLQWLPWAWRAFATGALWRPIRTPARPKPAPAPAPATDKE